MLGSLDLREEGGQLRPSLLLPLGAEWRVTIRLGILEVKADEIEERPAVGHSARSKKSTISGFILACSASRSKPFGSRAPSPATNVSAHG